MQAIEVSIFARFIMGVVGFYSDGFDGLNAIFGYLE
jgi:hypothetical protein